MQRAGAMRGFPRAQGNGSIKSRLGVPAGRRNVIGTGRGAVRGLGGIHGRLGVGGGIKSRLGAGAKGKRSLASVALGEILDARQKINFNRIQSGRIGDARQKIEEKRRKKSILDGKMKNLKIIAAVDVDAYRTVPIRPQGLISRSERQAMGYEGVFRSAVNDAYHYSPQNIPSAPMRLTRTVAGGAYPVMRIAPPSEDNFVLTRTIRNPTANVNAGYGGRGGDYSNRQVGHGVTKISPSGQYGSYSSQSHGGGGVYRSAHRDQPMDEDDYQAPMPTRRSEYSTTSSSAESQCRILVSNLQASVTADDIVELFSDIGPLVGARMASAGQAEVTYSRKSDALKAIEAYHNRLLDGSAMRVFLDSGPTSRVSASNSGAFTALKSASGASMKLPTPKSSSGIKIQPDLSAIHKVLFNPGSSGTRDLFKGGQ